MENESIVEVINLLPASIKSHIDKSFIEDFNITEIRIRKNKPIVLISPTKKYFIRENSIIKSCNDAVFVTSDEVMNIFDKLCHYSVYSYKENINSGFITMNGCRVGVVGSAVCKDGEIHSVKNISSLNFRFARQIDSCSLELLEKVYDTPFPSLLIIGSPCSGKTTLLRDMCRTVSSGYKGEYIKCCVIDERDEIADSNNFDVGINTDVLSAYPKKEGIIIALRALSPEVIFIDELGTVDEARNICEGLNSGVSFVCTLHAGSFEQALKREQFKLLFESGYFKYAVLLGTGENLGKAVDIKRL